MLYGCNTTVIGGATFVTTTFTTEAASREQGYYAAFEKAKNDIVAATSVSAVQAITLSNP